MAGVVESVRESLTDMESHPLAAVALNLAHQLESGDYPPAPIAKELRETLAALRDLTPRKQASASDDIAKRRAARLAKTTAG
jgi:hypothetical protein